TTPTRSRTSMRQIHTNLITDCVAALCIDACRNLPEDVIQGFHDASRREVSPLGKSVLMRLIKNDEIARANEISYCHDTGLTIVYVEVGQEVHLVGGDYQQAVQAGVRKG